MSDLLAPDRSYTGNCRRHNPSCIDVRHVKQRQNPPAETTRFLAIFRCRSVSGVIGPQKILEFPVEEDRMREHSRFDDPAGKRALIIRIGKFHQMFRTRQDDRFPSIKRKISRDLLAGVCADVASRRKMQRNEEDTVHALISTKGASVSRTTLAIDGTAPRVKSMIV